MLTQVSTTTTNPTKLWSYGFVCLESGLDMGEWHAAMTSVSRGLRVLEATTVAVEGKVSTGDKTGEGKRPLFFQKSETLSPLQAVYANSPYGGRPRN